MADAINEKLGVSLKMGQLAVDATNEVADITTCGDEINFPKYERVATVGNVTKGTALVPAEVSMTENKATIKQTGGSIRVYDKDAKQIKGATLDNMASQLVDAMVQDLDSSLSATMDAEATKKSPTASATAITFDEVLNAMALFGDSVEADSWSGLAINSRLLPSFLKMDEFTSVEKTYQSANNGIIKNGLVGYILNIPVVLTNNGTYDSTLSECKSYMIKKGALGYVKQQDVTLEIEREGKLLANDIIVSDLYATKVMDADGIVIIRKTVA
ncbi:MAG: hypothetical protein PHS59_18110 [Paludibacter sp.]|nr:hypothetical protein [Paludibacter sp.]